MPAGSVLSKPVFHEWYQNLYFGYAGKVILSKLWSWRGWGLWCDKKEGKTEEEGERGSHLVHRSHKAQTDCRDSSAQASDVGGVGWGTRRTDTSWIKCYGGYQCGLWCGAQWLSSPVPGLWTPSATRQSLWQLLIRRTPPPQTFDWCPHRREGTIRRTSHVFWYTCLDAFTFFPWWKPHHHFEFVLLSVQLKSKRRELIQTLQQIKSSWAWT